MLVQGQEKRQQLHDSALEAARLREHLRPRVGNRKDAEGQLEGQLEEEQLDELGAAGEREVAAPVWGPAVEHGRLRELVGEVEAQPPHLGEGELDLGPAQLGGAHLRVVAERGEHADAAVVPEAERLLAGGAHQRQREGGPRGAVLGEGEVGEEEVADGVAEGGPGGVEVVQAELEGAHLAVLALAEEVHDPALLQLVGVVRPVVLHDGVVQQLEGHGLVPLAQRLAQHGASLLGEEKHVGVLRQSRRAEFD